MGRVPAGRGVSFSAEESTTQSRAIIAPEPKAASHPKCSVSTGTSRVEAIPPRIPAVFITPERAPTRSRPKYAADTQNDDSALIRDVMLRDSDNNETHGEAE